jgi:hypothetical protein
MKQITRGLVVISMGTTLLACGSTPITLAPGADQVRITKNSSDVAGCAAVGNVDGHQYPLDHGNAMRQMQNQTTGLGGNTLFLTFDPGDHMINPPNAFATGVSYRCAKAVSPAQ